MQRIEIDYLMDRQLGDLLFKAAQILEGNDNDVAIQEFYRHSAGVKRFMKYYLNHSGIQKYISQVPEVDYIAPSQNLLSRITQIVFISVREKRDALKQQAVEGIRQAQHIYSSIYFLYELEAA